MINLIFTYAEKLTERFSTEMIIIAWQENQFTQKLTVFQKIVKKFTEKVLVWQYLNSYIHWRNRHKTNIDIACTAS